MIIAAIIAGIGLGILTGLTPGIHINLISALILTSSPLLLKYTEPITLAITITSMAVTHTFLDTIPSVFLGAPESDTALSILPGHRMLLEGKGYEAVMLTVLGSLFALIAAAAISPALVILVAWIYPLIKAYIGHAILITSLFLIYKERKSRLWALTIFALSGILGISVLGLDKLKEPLFPLLSGLFGTSMLILSINSNTKIPKQEKTTFGTDKKTCGKAISCSVIAGWVCSLMPGLGPSQAAIIGSQFAKGLGNKGFLMLVGGLSTVNMVLSFVTLYTLHKARNGAVVAIMKLVETIDSTGFALLIGTALIAGGAATFLAAKISNAFSKMMERVNYKLLCYTIITIIFLLVAAISGLWGIIVLITSTFLGMVPAIKGIGRNHMMGCLLLPVMAYFLL